MAETLRPQSDLLTERYAPMAANSPPPNFARQLELLRKKAPHLAEGVGQSVSQNVTVETGNRGQPTAVVTVDGNALYLHSRYDPARDSQRLCEEQLRSRTLPCVLIGFGLGYDAQAALSKIATATPLLIFENEEELYRAAFSNRHLEDLLNAPNVFWFGQRTKPEIMDELMRTAGTLADGVQWLVPPVSLKRMGDYHTLVEECVNEAVAYGSILRATRQKQGRVEITNLLANLGRYARAESMTPFRNCWKGKPAIVVAAGPSLSQNGHLLRQFHGRVPLIAVGAALRPLQAFGVQPDLAVHIDYSELCLRQFQSLGEPGKTLLICGPTAAPAPFEAWSGRIAMTKHPFAEHLLGELAPSQPEFKQGTSVAHTAFYAAQFIGADPIILVGLDLAFTDNTYYSAGNILHEMWTPELNRFLTLETKEWERLVRRKEALVKVAGWDGQMLFTDKPMAHYLQQFERDIGLTRARVIDATEGGARKAGATPMKLSEVLADLPPGETVEDFFPRQQIRETSNAMLQGRLRKARQRFRDYAVVLKEAAKQLWIAHDPNGNPKRKNKAFQQIDQLQRKLTHDYAQEFQMASTFDPSIEFQFQAATERIEKQPFTADEKLAELLRRDIVYTKNLAESAEEMVQLLQNHT